MPSSSRKIPREEARSCYRCLGTAAFLLAISLLYIFSSFTIESVVFFNGALQLEEQEFVERWLDVTSGSQSDGYALDYLCNKRQVNWQKNLILSLDDADGDISSIRTYVLDYVFFAIATGSSIVLPSFKHHSRSDDNPSLTVDRLPFDTFFDEDHFIQTVHRYCPQLHIYGPEQQSHMRKLESGSQLKFSLTQIKLGSDMKEIANEFFIWLRETYKQPLPPLKPTVVGIRRRQSNSSASRSLSDKFERDFGSLLLRTNPAAREIAAIVTYNLAQLYSLDLDPTSVYYRHAFLGAYHLQSGTDSDRVAILTALHTEALLSQAKSKGIKVIYLASSSSDLRKDFESYLKGEASKQGIAVVHKRDLVDELALAEVNGLSRDQQTLVDYEVLLRCSHFVDLSGSKNSSSSSFNHDIAVTRQRFMINEMGNGRVLGRLWRDVFRPRISLATWLKEIAIWE